MLFAVCYSTALQLFASLTLRVSHLADCFLESIPRYSSCRFFSWALPRHCWVLCRVSLGSTSDLSHNTCCCTLQIVFLVLELGTFISGLLFGVCHLCQLRPEKPQVVSEMAHRLRVSLHSSSPPLPHVPPSEPSASAFAPVLTFGLPTAPCPLSQPLPNLWSLLLCRPLPNGQLMYKPPGIRTSVHLLTLPTPGPPSSPNPCPWPASAHAFTPCLRCFDLAAALACTTCFASRQSAWSCTAAVPLGTIRLLSRMRASWGLVLARVST